MYFNVCKVQSLSCPSIVWHHLASPHCLHYPLHQEQPTPLHATIASQISLSSPTSSLPAALSMLPCPPFVPAPDHHADMPAHPTNQLSNSETASLGGVGHCGAWHV